MKIFDLKGGIITVEPETISIPEFKKIWDEDKSKDKHIAFKYFSFLYHTCDLASPFSNYSQSKKYSESVKFILQEDPDKFKPSKTLQAAEARYRDLTITPKQRLFESCKKKLDELANYIDETPVDDETIKVVLEMMNKLSSTVSNFDKLEEAVKKEQSSADVNRRGNKSTAMFED